MTISWVGQWEKFEVNYLSDHEHYNEVFEYFDKCGNRVEEGNDNEFEWALEAFQFIEDELRLCTNLCLHKE